MMNSVAHMRVLVLTRYSDLGASSRLRFFQYYPLLSKSGVELVTHCLISNKLLKKRYRVGSYGFCPIFRAYFKYLINLLKCRSFDIVWVEKELLPWSPLWFEKLLLLDSTYVLDYDDAVFHNYDLHPSKLVRLIYGKKLDGLMAGASLVVCGNEYLAKRAKAAGASRVQIMPTVIDFGRYKFESKELNLLVEGKLPMRIVWVGTPSTEKYLKLLIEPLQNLAKTHNFVLRLIGVSNFEIPGVSIELVEWSEESEFKDIAACDIGIMPLLNTPWECGKCGYKLIQYMASGLPIVASNVGVNSQIVKSGINGYLVDTPSGWIESLGELLDNRGMRIEMGLAGRQSVEQEYSVQKQGHKFIRLLRAIANK